MFVACADKKTGIMNRTETTYSAPFVFGGLHRKRMSKWEDWQLPACSLCMPLLLFFLSHQAMLRPKLPFSALPFVKISPRPNTTRTSLTPSTTSARPQMPQIVLWSHWCLHRGSRWCAPPTKYRPYSPIHVIDQLALLNITKSTMALPMLSIKTHVAKSIVLAEKAYQHEKARKEQAKRAHGAVLCEMPGV